MKHTNVRQLLLLLFSAALIQGCTTLSRCERKYGRGAMTDTTYVTVPVAVPRDSAVLVTRTQVHFDTNRTRIVEHIKQGRATVTLIREPVSTTVLANCDSVIVEKRVPVEVVRSFGVASWWRVAALAEFALLGLIIGSLWFLAKFKVTRR